MKREPVWRRYLRFWGPTPDQDVDDEFSFHIAAKTDELIEAGRSPAEARQEALRRFGPMLPVHSECKELRRGLEARASRLERITAWRRDLSYAARVLLRAKGASAAAVVILALGIGGVTAVFTLLDRLLYKPLPVPNAGELVLIRTMSNGNPSTIRYADYAFLRDNNSTLSGLAGYGAYRMQERTGDHPAQAAPVTGNFFETLRVSAVAGRGLQPQDDRPGAPRVAVASHAFATARFGNPNEAVGKNVRLNDDVYTIVGVLPASFASIWKASTRGDLYVSIAAMAESYHLDLSKEQYGSMYVFGRRKPGVALVSVQANLETQLRQVSNAKGVRVLAEDGSAGYQGIQGESMRSLQLLGVILAALLVMTCINVGCLSLARGAARQQEMTVRLALGAGKFRIARQILAECCLLSFAGGIAGFGVAVVAERLMLAGLRFTEQQVNLALDGRVLAFGLGASLLTGLLCGLAPVFQLLRDGRLSQNSQRPLGAFSSGRTLVVAEIALSVVMVAGAAIFLRGYANLRSTPLGFDARDVVAVRLSLKDGSAPSGQLEATMLRAAAQVADRVRLDPRVSSAAVGTFLPFNEGSITYPVRREPGTAPRNAILMRVDPSYFDAMRIPVAAGPGFALTDDLSAPPVTMIGESLAKTLFPDTSVVGKGIFIGRDRATVVGVVRDIKFGSVKQTAPVLLYLPVAQQVGQGGASSGEAKLHLRTQLPPRDAEALARQTILAEKLPLTVGDTVSLEDEIGASYFNDTVRMQATTTLGGLALLLIAAGIYGLMSFWVSQRTREIGVRVAVGSSTSGILKLVLKQSLRLVALGLIVGVPCSILLVRYLASMIFEAPATDVVSVIFAAGVLIATGTLAAFVPAWRAAKLDPLTALRME